MDGRAILECSSCDLKEGCTRGSCQVNSLWKPTWWCGADMVSVDILLDMRWLCWWVSILSGCGEYSIT